MKMGFRKGFLKKNPQILLLHSVIKVIGGKKSYFSLFRKFFGDRDYGY